ncbi:MAG TPA: hypothetical protein VNW92_20640 [Polyangiaceae bacterium]|jgi:hypothetical protein|nr:hypothetical protein [Polyangiaceae bacterium]
MNGLSMRRAKKANLSMTAVLGVAIVAAGAFAFAGTRVSVNREPPASAAEPSPAEMPAAEAVANAAQGDSAPLNGEVLETLAVSKYTYLRLRTSTGETWAAVPSATIALGSHVAIADATRMDDFKSSTLKRTFQVIYFGTLAPAGTAPAAAPAAKFSAADVPAFDDDSTLPPGHPDIGAAAPSPSPVNDSDPLPPGHPEVGAAPSSPHAGMNEAAGNEPALPLLKIERARGGNAHLISELQSERKLVGQRVRVRGQVTKVTPNVQGHTFFHMRDGSPSGGTAGGLDLIVTSSAEPQRGQVATFEGTLRADVDVGIGYKYPLLLENATLVDE